MTIKKHYDNHLADFYSWMVGNFTKNKDLFKNFCIKNEIKPFKNNNAIDLGAGNGIQSVALGEIGYKVCAVDFSETLLRELTGKINGLKIEPVEDDIKNIKHITKEQVDLITCCGDTIAHLETFEQLEKLIKDSYNSLTENGKLILSFRDYTVSLSGTERFIPVKSDKNRILTCILDYCEDKISVTDLLHERKESGWIQKVSSYKKLRLKRNRVIDIAQKAGFSLYRDESIHRMIYLILNK